MRIKLMYILAFLLGFSFHARAQEVDSAAGGVSWLDATLMGWMFDQELYLMDGISGVNGWVGDRGPFQTYTPLMDDESDLDWMTYRFSPNEDYQWYRSSNGYRTWLGSSNDLSMAQQSELKSEVAFRNRHALSMYMQTQQTFRANRAFALLEYKFRANERFQAGVNHTLQGFQAEMDLGLYAQYGDYEKGFLRLDVKLLNYLNNLVFEDAQTPVIQADTIRHYEQKPAYFSIKGVTPKFSIFRAEFFAGVQTPSIAVFASNSTPSTFRFRQEDLSYVFGTSVTAKTKYLSFMGYFTRTFSQSKRDTVGLTVYNPDYETQQALNTAGLGIMGFARDIRWDSWIIYEHFSDESNGQNIRLSPTVIAPFDLSTSRWMLRSRLQYRPPLTGPIAGVEHLLDLREFEGDLDEYTAFSDAFFDSNSRLSFTGGWQFNPRTWIIVGYSLDLDRDVHLNPDGQINDRGFLRLEHRW